MMPRTLYFIRVLGFVVRNTCNQFFYSGQSCHAVCFTFMKIGLILFRLSDPEKEGASVKNGTDEK